MCGKQCWYSCKREMGRWRDMRRRPNYALPRFSTSIWPNAFSETCAILC